jgi:hypothetical protein
MGCDTKRPQVTQHQGRPESERYGHYPHALPSLPHTQPRPNSCIRRRSTSRRLLRGYRTSKAPDPQRLNLLRLAGHLVWRSRAANCAHARVEIAGGMNNRVDALSLLPNALALKYLRRSPWRQIGLILPLKSPTSPAPRRRAHDRRVRARWARRSHQSRPE